MLPLIREESDLVVIRKPVQPLKKHDIVLYRIQKEKAASAPGAAENTYVLHRIIKCEEDRCIILGDNCISLEYVPKTAVVGVMSGLLRQKEAVNLKSIKYRLYMNLWIKPWRMRVLSLKIRRKAGAIKRRLSPGSGGRKNAE